MWTNELPSSQRRIWLNHAGVAPISRRAAEAMRAWIDRTLTHGPSASRAEEEEVDAARIEAASLLHAHPDEIAFVRNTSHGIGLVATGLQWRDGDEVLLDETLEFPSNVHAWRSLASRGVVVRSVSNRERHFSIDAVRAAMSARTRLVAVSAVQYATGQRVDLASLGTLCRERGVLLCVDAIQLLGAAPFHPRELGVHFAAADGHKWLLGPSGAGVFYAAEETRELLRPAIVGWKSMHERWTFDALSPSLRDDAARFEEGSLPYVAIAGLRASMGLIREVGINAIAARLGQLTAHVEASATKLGERVGPSAQERAGIVTLSAPLGIERALNEAGIEAAVRGGRLRLSPHFYNTEDELSLALQVVARTRRSV